MEIFISWSGSTSRETADALRLFLSSIFGQRVQTWFSPLDIPKGKLWNNELSAALGRANFGIICVTRANRSAPWLLFEAGAVAKAVSASCVCPFLVDLTPSEIDGPLAQFQVTRAQRTETTILVRQINEQLSPPIGQLKLNTLIKNAWTQLERRLKSIRARRKSALAADDDVRKELVRFLRHLNSYEDFATLLRPAPFSTLLAPRTRGKPLLTSRKLALASPIPKKRSPGNEKSKAKRNRR